MINLLPHEEKRQLQAARTNTLLIRYNILLLGVIGFMGLAIGITYIFLSNTLSGAEQTIASDQARVSQYASVQAQATQFRERLSTAKQILDNEVTYSKVVLEIAQLVPSGVVLQNISLDSQTFGTPTTLIGQAKDYASALAFKDSFSKSPLFTDVHFTTIDTSSGTGSYPVTVNLDVTIKKDAAK